jgi:hypothetical protein
VGSIPPTRRSGYVATCAVRARESERSK